MEEEVVYETINQEEIRYGTNDNKFLEISRKRVQTGNEFLAIAKGFYNKRGEKKYKTSIGFPIDDKLIQFIVENLQKV